MSSLTVTQARRNEHTRLIVEAGFIEDEIDVEERRGDFVCDVIGNAKVRGSCVSRIIRSVKEEGTVPSIVWLC